MKLPKSSKDIIQALQDRVTPERLKRIETVLAQRTSHASIVLEGIYDRGNASAVMRSAEAFGFYQLHMIELQEKFKESKRVTQGAHKWLDIYKWKSTKECVEKLRQQKRKIYVTHLSETAKPLGDIDLAEPFAICFGNEKDGATEELISLADESVYIPMKGFVQSFNISVAAAICFYHLSQALKDKPISQTEQQELKAYYLMQSVENWESYL